MPNLEITRAGLAPEHSAATIDYLLSVMLWPRDSDQRAKFMRTCRVWWEARRAEAVPAMGTAAGMDALYARSPDDWQSEIEDRIHLGAQVGEFYAAAWEHNSVLNQPVALGELRARMTTPERRDLHPAVVGDKTLQTALHDFRPAATLWAAKHILQAEGFDATFPCRPDRIPEFLGLAETVRLAAMKVSLPRRGEGRPMLAASEDVWRPPGWMTLPRLRLA